MNWLMAGGAASLEAGVAHGVSANGWVGRPHYLPEEKTHTFWCVSRAIEFIHNRDPSTPFILFTSDHGEMLGDHNMVRKTFAYEASARVPLIARAPGSFGCPTEIVSSAPVGLQDVMPTLIEAAGVPVPDNVTGRSLLPLMRKQQEGWREALHGEHAGCYRNEDGMHYLTDGHFKYIWYSQTGKEHLFNLDDDPNELRNLASHDCATKQMNAWRQRLRKLLAGRPEGFTDGKHLIAGRPHHAMFPGA
ncbi:MAG: sulfatase-like hydrolase/transferase [Verrucomicrobia bacterium]|nr:sulfatase-like hydrolase/transferase [Verrucomicrobiota bacterium]